MTKQTSFNSKTIDQESMQKKIYLDTKLLEDIKKLKLEKMENPNSKDVNFLNLIGFIGSEEEIDSVKEHDLIWDR